MAKRRPLLLVGTLAAVIVASLALRLGRDGGSPPDGVAPPSGWWRLDAVRAEPAADEELARQLSLPYAAGVVHPSGGRVGVVAWDPGAAQPGVNLYVSGHAHEAVLLAMDGRVLHRWRSTLAGLFPAAVPSADNGFFRRAALLSDGSILGLVQGEGLVRLDERSRLVWRRAEPLFNDLWVSPEEDRILVLAKRPGGRPELRQGTILEDSLVTLDGDGRVVERASLLDALSGSPYRSLLEPLGDTADILHSNTIEVLGGPGAAAGSVFAPGHLLVSLREIDTVAVLDRSAETVLWAQRGPWVRQHEPSLLPDGRLLVFDNRGGEMGRSRVVALDPANGALETLFAGFAGVRFVSVQAGACRQLGNGNLLVVASESGIAWEITPAGEIAWELRSPHRAGPRRALVATLFDVVRYSEPTSFLARFDSTQAP